MHYPFVSAFPDKVLDAVRTGRYGKTTTDEYVAYARRLAENGDVTLLRPSARRFTGLEALLADEFLVASDDYRRWVTEYAAAGCRVKRLGNLAGRFTSIGDRVQHPLLHPLGVPAIEVTRDGIPVENVPVHPAATSLRAMCPDAVEEHPSRVASPRLLESSR
jgi:hypothetical protein